MAYTIDQIVEAANKQTERRAEGQLDLRLEFFQALQELIHECRFWWAKKTTTFNTVIGTATYDLSSGSVANAQDVEEIIGVWRIDSATENVELTPILEPADQVAAIEATASADVGSYMVEPGAWQTLRLGAPANAVKKLRVLYWAGVNPDYDASDSAVPLVPGPLHWGLVIAVKRRILEFLYGQNDPRYLVAEAQYRNFVQKAAHKPRFTTNAQREFRSGESAVRAW